MCFHLGWLGMVSKLLLFFKWGGFCQLQKVGKAFQVMGPEWGQTESAFEGSTPSPSCVLGNTGPSSSWLRVLQADVSEN